MMTIIIINLLLNDSYMIIFNPTPDWNVLIHLTLKTVLLVFSLSLDIYQKIYKTWETSGGIKSLSKKQTKERTNKRAEKLTTWLVCLHSSDIYWAAALSQALLQHWGYSHARRPSVYIPGRKSRCIHSYGCHNKLSQTGCLKTTNIYSHSSGDQEPQIQVSAWSVFGEDSLLSL